MIGFACDHCDGSVYVSDAHAGRKGRCPHCHSITAIPPVVGGCPQNAASRARKKLGSGKAPAVPPPPSSGAVEVDEFDLVDLRTSSAFETDTYPAICGQHGPRRLSDADRAAPTPPLAQGVPAGWLSRRNLVVAITTAAVLTAAAVVACFLVRQ